MKSAELTLVRAFKAMPTNFDFIQSAIVQKNETRGRT
jgi:hypothetical protein